MRAIEPEIRALVSARVRDGRALHDARGLIDDHARLYVAATHNYKNSVPLVQTALSDHRRYSRGRYNNNGANGELLGSDGALSSDEVRDSRPISRLAPRKCGWLFPVRGMLQQIVGDAHFERVVIPTPPSGAGSAGMDDGDGGVFNCHGAVCQSRGARR